MMSAMYTTMTDCFKSLWQATFNFLHDEVTLYSGDQVKKSELMTALIAIQTLSRDPNAIVLEFDLYKKAHCSSYNFPDFPGVKTSVEKLKALNLLDENHQIDKKTATIVRSCFRKASTFGVVHLNPFTGTYLVGKYFSIKDL